MSKKTKLKKDLILEVAQLQKRVKELETAKADDNLGDVLPTSEQSKMEQTLRESEKRWRTLATSSPDHILILSPDLKIEYANFASPGLSIDDIVGKKITSFLEEEKQEEIKAILMGVIKTGKSTLYETEYLTPDGGIIYYETHAIARKSAGDLIGLTLNSRDITERKLAENELEEIFNLSPDMVGVFTTEGKLLKVNPAWTHVLGFTQEEFLVLGWVDFVHPDDVEETNKVVKEQLKGSSVVNFINRYKCKNGSYRTLEWQASFATKGIVHATARDITERKLAEEVVARNEALFKGVFAQAPVGIELYDAQGNLTSANQVCLNIFGVDHVEAIMGFNLFEDPNVSDEAKLQLRKGKLVDYEAEFDFEITKKLNLYKTTKSGKCFLRVQITPYELDDINQQGFVVHVQDITERKRAEEKDHHRREELSVLLKTSQALNETLQLDIVLQTTTDSTSKLLDVDSVAIYLLEGDELFLGATTPALDPQMPDYLRRAPLSDHPHILSAISSRQIIIIDDTRSSDLNEHEKSVVDMRGLITIAYIPLIVQNLVLGVLILGSTGATRIFSDSEINLGKTLANQIAGGLHNAIMHEESKQHTRDLETQMAERIKLEMAFAESEKKFRGYVETSQDLIWECDSEGRFIYLNPAWEDVTGYKLSEMLNKSFTDFTSSEEVEENTAEFTRHLENGFVQGYPLTYIGKNGAEINLIFNAIPILDDNKNIIGTQGSAYDITERVQAENKLLKNQYYLTKAQEIGVIGTWELDIQKDILRWTDENYNIFGVPLGTNMNIELFLNCVHPDDRDFVNEKWNVALNYEPFDIEHRIIANDEIKWVREKAEIEFGSDGKPVLAIGFTQDITERKLAENKLIESEAYIKAVMDNLPIGLAVNSVDPTVEFNYMNDNFTKFYRTTREALEPQDSFWNVVYEDPVYREQIKKRVLDDIASGDPEQMIWDDIQITRKGEKTTFISARNTPLPDSHFSVSTVWDVSERKEAELEKDLLLEQLQAANERLKNLSRELINSQEEERKRISQELHDDLGQALTAITLDLKIIERDLDPETSQDIRQRLVETRTIADELDQKIGELALDLRPSLLDDLGLLPALSWYLERWSQRAEVKGEIESRGRKKRLPPEIETAIYRITQETLTNVAKHAEAKNVLLHLDQRAKEVILIIEDDGKGFDYDEAQNKQAPPQGLGLIGIRDRISLVGGHFEVKSKSGEGTRIMIEIPL